MLFDIQITDTDAQSNGNMTPRDVLAVAKKEKKHKYTLACEERRAVFTPICCSVDEMIGKEGKMFFKTIAENLSQKWEKSYSKVMFWLRARISFAILRASVLCLRGSRTKWRCLGLEDGAPISLSLH